MKLALLTPLGLLAVVTSSAAQTANWSQSKPSTSPPGRIGHAMVYDSARQRTVLFGGNTKTGNSTDTWEWDGKNWAQIITRSSPPFGSFAMAYDSARRVTLYYGTHGTWEYDGKNWSQRKPVRSPTGRLFHAMAYDSARNRTVLFGGMSNLRGDTWEWDGRNWTNTKSAPAPAPRFGHAMAYDSARQRVVLFGGSDNYESLQDTWEWDGKNWTHLNFAAAPPERQLHAMAYDSARQRTVLTSGLGGPGYLADTWEWDGKNWTRISRSTTPGARLMHAMAYDSVRQRTVLFGGSNGGLPVGTWEYGSSTLTLTANTTTIVIATGGSQALTVNAGTELAGKSYWIFGSSTASMPGVMLSGIHVPLAPDLYTYIMIGGSNSREFKNFKGTLNASGSAIASLNIPAKLALPPGFKLYHAYVVYDSKTDQIFTASNPVPVELK